MQNKLAYAFQPILHTNYTNNADDIAPYPTFLFFRSGPHR